LLSMTYGIEFPFRKQLAQSLERFVVLADDLHLRRDLIGALDRGLEARGERRESIVAQSARCVNLDHLTHGSSLGAVDSPFVAERPERGRSSVHQELWLGLKLGEQIAADGSGQMSVVDLAVSVQLAAANTGAGELAAAKDGELGRASHRERARFLPRYAR